MKNIIPAPRHVAEKIAATKSTENEIRNNTYLEKSADQLWYRRFAHANGTITQAMLKYRRYDMTNTNELTI